MRIDVSIVCKQSRKQIHFLIINRSGQNAASPFYCVNEIVNGPDVVTSHIEAEMNSVAYTDKNTCTTESTATKGVWYRTKKYCILESASQIMNQTFFPPHRIRPPLRSFEPDNAKPVEGANHA